MRTIRITTAFTIIAIFAPLAGLAGSGSWSEGDVFHGEVTVDAIRGRGIAVAVDRFESGAADGRVEEVFLLQLEDRIPTDLRLHLDEARVVVWKRAAIVVSRDERVVVELFLDDERPDRMLEMVEWARPRAGRRGEASVLSFRGFGLSRTVGSWSSSSEALEILAR